MKRLIYSLLLISVGLLIACKPTQVSNDSIVFENLLDGKYTGEASGINKAVVEVVIVNHKIVTVKLLELDATPFGQKAKDTIPARIVTMQKAQVDAVSGATEASNTIMNATIDALKKAQSK
jgi:uncharacterized protein with FMN-binding domain